LQSIQHENINQSKQDFITKYSQYIGFVINHGIIVY